MHNTTLSQYFDPRYYSFIKRAAQPPAPPMDPAMTGGAPPMDPAMMGGMPPMPPGAPPMDPAMMGGMPPAPPMDPAMMGGMPPMPPAPPAGDPAAAGAPKSGKQQKEEFMNNIQTCLDDIKDYTYNNLMILIRIANALNIQIPAETLVAPPDGKNMDIMADPTAISSMAATGAGPGMAPPQEAAPMPPEAAMGAEGMGPQDLPPADQAPSEVKMSMYNRGTSRVKQAMNFLLSQKKKNTSDQMAKWLRGN